MDSPEAPQPPSLPEASRRAYEMLARGVSAADVRDQLVEAGLDGPTAEAIVNSVVLRFLYDYTAELLKSGLAPADAERRLIEKGVDPGVAAAIVAHVLDPHAGSTDPAKEALSRALQVVGGVVVVLGAMLLAGNVTGLFPTLPLAGGLTMLLGGALYGAGQKMR